VNRFLIDRRGVISPVERGMRRYTHYKLPPDADAVIFAIRHLGVIEVAIAAAGVRVRLRPQLTSARALSRLLYFLAELRPRRFVLSHFARGWHEELVPGFPALVTRIEELVHGVRSRFPEKPFHAEERPLDPEVSLIARPFARLLQEWTVRGGMLPEDPTVPFRRAGCLGRTTLTQHLGDSRLVIAYRGRHLTHYGSAGWTKYVGLPVDEQPDAQFSVAASLSLPNSQDRQQPVFEACEATIASPSGMGRRSIYERLLLPWRTQDGSWITSGVSQLRGRTDWKNPVKPQPAPGASGPESQSG
jgi:hypothetical protein